MWYIVIGIIVLGVVGCHCRLFSEPEMAEDAGTWGDF